MSPSIASDTPDGSARPPLVGLSYGTVTVVDHDPGWVGLFDQLSRPLSASLGSMAVAIEHVGSTAVPELKAKPIIDIAIGIRPADASSVIDAMTRTGWLFRGDKGDDGGLLFVYESAPLFRVAHAHVVVYGGPAWNDYLAFRDLLRADAVARVRYEQLKQQLAAEHSGDRAAYTAGKQELVRQLMGR